MFKYFWLIFKRNTILVCNFSVYLSSPLSLICPWWRAWRFLTDPRHELRNSQKVGLKYKSFLSEEGNDYTDRRYNENAPMQFILILIYENNFLSATSEVNSSILNLESAIKKRATFFYWNYTISIVLGTTILEQNQKQKSEISMTKVLKLQEIHMNCPKLDTEGCVVYAQVFLGKRSCNLNQLLEVSKQ